MILINRVVSLFCGAGGLDLGFIKQGFKVIWAIDFYKAATKTYRNNLGDHIVCEDITEINHSDIPDCDCIIGGSPCQGFSNANRTTNFLDNPKNFLVREYIKIIKAKQPKVFVLENVPQLITCGNGQFKDEILKVLNEYEIEYKILNAVDYGTPQERKRAIFIGSRIGRIYHPEPKLIKYKTINEAFEGLNDSIPNQNEFTISKDIVIQRMKLIPPGGNYKNLPPELRTKSNHSTMYRRLDPNKPSVTLVHPIKTLLTHPYLNRILSVRECARIQDFPDSFVFYGTLSEKYQQLANAVPVGLAEAIATEVKKQIKQVTINKQKVG